MLIAQVRCEFHCFSQERLYVVLSRSPWTNRYFPQREDGYMPSPELRDLEVDANDIFNEYRRM